RRWTRSHRSAENKARRCGISVRRASTDADWERYYELYQRTLARWGDSATSRYGQRLFRAMARRNSPDVGLWLAEAPGVGPVAGVERLPWFLGQEDPGSYNTPQTCPSRASDRVKSSSSSALRPSRSRRSTRSSAPYLYRFHRGPLRLVPVIPAIGLLVQGGAW